jgi:D-3-phosphoglycerate dehydrogenase
MKDIFVSTFPFARVNQQPLDLIKESGFSYLLNPFHKKPNENQLLELGRDFKTIIAGTEDLEEYVKSNNNLRFISRVGVGLDSVPLKLCKEKNIKVSYTPNAVTYAVAEMTLGLMISLSRKLFLADKMTREGDWSRHQGKSLPESTIGIIGFGRIGKEVARLLQAFSVKEILVHDIVPVDLTQFQKLSYAIKKCSLEELLSLSDIVTVHVSKNKKTENLINVQNLSLMSKDSYLINTSRGGIVNENDLFESLVNKKILGAALDVFSNEPYHGKLTTLENVILTQHMGSCSDLCRKTMELQATLEVIRFLKGEPLMSEVPEIEYN